jgi:hypothetical protein
LARVPSLYYQDGPGKDFHMKDKPLLMSIATGLVDFNMFKNLVIRPEWLVVDKGDSLSESMKLSVVIRDEYVREMPRLLRTTKWLNRLAIHKLANFLVILHRNDDMYYERFGYLMHRFIERSDEWKQSDKAGRLQIIDEEKTLYFTHEKRLDRIVQIRNVWNYIHRMYESDEGIMRSVDFIVERLGVHRSEYNYDEVSRLGIIAFHPENWYPVGRGQLWDLAHAGQG